MKLFQLHNDFFSHFFVNIPVAVEGFGFLNVAGYLGDEVWILELLVEIPNQDAAGHVGACNLPNRVLFFFPGQGIDDRYLSVNPGEAEHFLDVAVIILGTSKGKKATPGNVWIAFQNFQGRRTKGDPNRNRTTLLCLSRNVFDGAIDHVTLLHLEQVSDPATDETMKDEDVTLYFKPRILRELCCIKDIPFLLSDIERRSVHRLSNLVLVERVIDGQVILLGPFDESPETGHSSDNVVLPTRFRIAALGYLVIDFLITAVNDYRLPFFILTDELMFCRKIISELPKRIGSQVIQFNACTGIECEPLQRPIQDFVLPLLGFRDIVHLNEVRQCRDGRIVHRTLSFSFGNLDAIQQFRRKPHIHEFNLTGSRLYELILNEGGNLLQFLVHLLETLDKNRLHVHKRDLYIATFRSRTRWTEAACLGFCQIIAIFTSTKSISYGKV